VVGGRKHDFRSGGGKVTERVRVSSDTLDFKDIDESLWEKGLSPLCIPPPRDLPGLFS
jgi:hypothetical protein